jgi:hypothetical protein
VSGVIEEGRDRTLRKYGLMKWSDRLYGRLAYCLQGVRQSWKMHIDRMKGVWCDGGSTGKTEIGLCINMGS